MPCLLVALVIAALALMVPSAQAQEAPSGITRPVGTVKAITGNTVTLATDAGSTISILIQDSTHIVRTAPGQKDLQGATPVQLPDLQIGDRMVVRGKTAGDGQSILALSVIVMKGSDIAARQEQEREDWRKRGVGGLVTAVDAANGTIAVSTSGMGARKSVSIHISKDTIVRRYAPDSVKFDDATPGTLDQIKPGDQLRARGNRTGDGNELTAEEIVSGAFRNIAGTVISADPANHSVIVTDLATHKPVTLRISSDSQLHSLPAMLAQRIASRLKSDSAPPAGQATDAKQGSDSAGSTPAGARAGGQADFQQMLGRMPAATLADLQKGTAVMIVATQGTANSEPTAITLLTGVEPILSASPDTGRAAMLLSPWNLSGSGGGEAGGGANP